MEQKSPSNPRQKMNYACEACRAAKTRCQSGPQPDICKRCSEFKRECIFRTGPRIRRPKASSRIFGKTRAHHSRDSEAASLPPPPGPSKTFSIDFEMPEEQEPSDDFEKLRQDHERILEDLVLNDNQEENTMPEGGEDIARLLNGSVPEPGTFNFNDMSSTPSASLSGTSSSWAESSARSLAAQKSRPLMNLGIKPQFNLDSAAKLLESFREMLPHMPCLVLPENLDVRLLARKSPFVLLAILAVTSCSSSLQGHSLYDEEFRKVLGLKFVAGGERSLELLQGILIYCAWYPFHLRPKNKQSFQYLRMAVDIVHDLEMDQDPGFDFSSLAPNQRARKLDDMRALLGCFYGMSAFSATWNRAPTFRYSPQLSLCAEALERNSELEQDRHLAWLVRFQYIFEELVEMQRIFERGPKDNQAIMQRNIIRAGLETQFRDFTQKMPAQYGSITSILLASQVTEAILLAPALVRMPRKLGTQDSEPSNSASLLQAAQIVRSVFDHIVSLLSGGGGFAGFAGADYGRFIIAVILGYRLSFPLLALCRDYDVAQGRQILDLGGFLRKLVEEPPEDEVRENEDDAPKGKKGGGDKTGVSIGVKKQQKKTDAASALKVVLRSVRVKFEEKSAAFEAMRTAATGQEWATRDASSNCPMINGSLDSYISLWAGQPQVHSVSGTYSTSQTSTSGPATVAALGLDPGTQFVGPMAEMGLGGGSLEDKPLMYHDLWTSMTLGWAGDMGEVNMEDIGNMGYGELLDQS